MKDNKMIITLTSETGEKIDYELLDVVSYNNHTYTVFYPTDGVDTEVVILRIEDIENSNQSNYIVETDESVIKEVYKQFKEKYRGKILFAEKKDIEQN